MGNSKSSNFEIEADEADCDITLYGTFENRDTRALFAILTLAEQSFKHENDLESANFVRANPGKMQPMLKLDEEHVIGSIQDLSQKLAQKSIKVNRIFMHN